MATQRHDSSIELKEIISYTCYKTHFTYIIFKILNAIKNKDSQTCMDFVAIQQELPNETAHTLSTCTATGS
jgi:hypothetical protein